MGYMWIIKEKDFKTVLSTVNADFQSVVRQSFKSGECFGEKVKVVYYGDKEGCPRIEDIELPESLKEYGNVLEVLEEFSRLAEAEGLLITEISIEHNDAFVS